MTDTHPGAPMAIPAQAGDQRVVLVTGPSGAGRSSALAVLEDLGFEAIDNMPLALVPRLLDGAHAGPPLALGVDPRTRGFSAEALGGLIRELASQPGRAAEVLYVDCREDVLLRRFSETRRRHPLAPAESPAIGITREHDLLAPIRDLADRLIDTSELSPHDLRARLGDWFAAPGGFGLSVAVTSFSYKRGIPPGLDWVFDCRFLRNPYWQSDLRALTGLAPATVAHVAGDPRFGDFLERLRALFGLVLPACRAEGRAHVTIGLGCTGGQHRSVVVAERLGAALGAEGWQVSTRHRELDRRAQGAPAITGKGA